MVCQPAQRQSTPVSVTVADRDYLRRDGRLPTSGDIYIGSGLGIRPTADASAFIGSSDAGLKKIHFSRASLSSGPRSSAIGLHWLNDTYGDFFVASNIAYPNFYVQFCSKANTSTLDSSEWASCIYQGNWGAGATPVWPFVEIQWGTGDGSTGAYIMGEDGATLVRDGAASVGVYDQSAAAGGGGLIVAGRFSSGGGLYILCDETGGQSSRGDVELRTLSGSKAAQYVNTISFAGTRLLVVRPKSDDVVSLGDATHQWTDLFFTGQLNWASAPTYTPTNVTTDRSYDANSTSIDELADVLGTVIADLQSLGVLV